ncbi:MAG: cell surface protein SprA [Fidelibacterota bacterium]
MVLCLSLGLGSQVHGQDSSILPDLLPRSSFPTTLLYYPFDSGSPSLIMPADTLVSPRGLIKFPARRISRATIDDQWSYVTLSETVGGVVYQIPFVAPVDWYVEQMIRLNRQKQLLLAVKEGGKGKGAATEKQSRRGQGIEVVGVDVENIGRVSINATGNVSLKGKMVFQDQELIRSKISETQNTHLEFDQTQRISVEGKIGDRVSVKVDHDSERDFDWENNIRISYQGEEDDIIQKVEAGNVSLNLPGSQSLMGSANHKGLFGVKTVSKFGPVDVTAIASVVNTEKKSQEYKGSNEAQTVKIKDYDYIKNKYFFIYPWFRDGIDTTVVTDGSLYRVQIPSFYPLKDGFHLIGNVIIRQFELYQLDQSTNAETNPGTAYADLNNHDESYDQTGTFKRLEQGQDYIISEDLGYIRLRQKVNDEVLGCTFVLADRTTGDTVMVVGMGITPENDHLELKMLKPRSMTPAHPVWPLMFKNVYYLGASAINQEGFELRIVNERLPVPSHLDPLGTPYITYFGLDSVNENGERLADQKVDLSNPNVINLQNGELILPSFYPFVSADSLPGGNQNAALKGALGAGKMYTTTQRTDISNDNRFTIEVDYANQSSTINLGFMVVEGSEQVFKGEVPLKRSIDYQIDYFSGTIILNEDVDPNADIRVVYDKHQLVTFDKRTVLGLRSQMDLGEHSFLGGTALYYNQSVVNEKVEVGYEPMRNFIWGMNGRLENEISGLTRALDRLPMIETDAPSKFSVEGEFAQILPNPNPVNNSATGDANGVAYIDDFEGSKRTTSLSVQRRFWKESSAPLDLRTGQPFNQRYRARLNWYNPTYQVRTNDIWPNLSTSIQAQNETTDILVLKSKVRSHQEQVPRDSIWAGITIPFYTGDYDQTQTKFFEIWVRGEVGKLSVDLGQISEDWDGNGKLNTEDIPVGGLIGDGILADKEDVGLDGCPDEFEDGWGSCLDPEGPTYQELKDEGETELINVHDDVDPEDPNGDNWYYREGSQDYSRINGTERNALDAGKYPDTEDLDRTGFLDRTNDYFTKTFSLSDTTYLAGETKKNGVPTGWRLFRVPLVDFEPLVPGGNREWNNIHHLRLVVTDMDTTTIVQVAKVELVGNEWLEIGLAAASEEPFNLQNSDSIFSIAVVNTDDNAGYQPPRGVRGEYDRINQIRSKEQSLVLKFDDLPGGYSGAAMKTLIALSGERAKSYLTYDRMKMFVYGHSPWINTQETQVEFFLQFGFGDNYYELRQPVYNGWDEELKRNQINLDLNWLTRLKLQDSTDVEKFRETDSFTDSADVKVYRFTDETGVFTGKEIHIQGQPSLNRIQFFIVGVRNRADEPVSGEVWLDELRLSGVRRDRGISMRLQGRFNLGDIANTSLIYKRQDADFHTLQQRLGSNTTGENFNFNTSIKLDKILPAKWGLSVPLSTSFANVVNRPKYYPGQDIEVLSSTMPDSILSKSQTVNVSVKTSKTSKSDNRLIKYSLDKLNTNFSASRTRQSNEIQKRVLSENYRGQVNYALPFGRNNYFMPLKWLSEVPWVGPKLGSAHLYYTPSNVNVGLNFAERLTQKQPWKGAPSPDVYDFNLNQSYSMDYQLTETVKTKYSRSIKSNLNEYRGYAWLAAKNRDPGVVTDIQENLNTSYNPIITDWLKPTFSYSANYRWNKDRNSTIDGANIGNQLRFSSGLSISPIKLIEMFYKPTGGTRPGSQQRSRTSSRSRTRSRTQPVEEQGKPKSDELKEPGVKRKKGEESRKKVSSGSTSESAFLHALYTWSKKINPINFSYTENINRTGRGVLGTPPMGYRMGWLADHGLPYSDQVGTNTGSRDHKRDFSIRTGLNLSRQISLSMNFAQSVSTNLRGSGLEQRTLSRDYLSYGKHLNSGFPFVGWSLRWTGLERNRYLRKWVRTVSLDHAVSGKEARSWQFEQFKGPAMPLFAVGNFISANHEQERSTRVNINFSPVIGVTLALKNGVAVTLRHNRTLSRDESPNGGQKLLSDRSYNATANYMRRGGFTIPIPFFNDFKVQNQVNFTFNFDMNKNRTQQKALQATKFAETAFTSSWKTGIRITYSFSNNVSGSIIWEYRESDSKHTGKKIDRDFGFDVNLAIRG